MNTSFTPGKIWQDKYGEPIQADGGSMLYHDGTYYWFGENRNGTTKRSRAVGFNMDAVGISRYASTDLYNWENLGLVLPSLHEPAEHELHTSKIIERPKVIYNDLTRQFVVFMHLDTSDYRFARLGIAISDKVSGPYDYLGSIIPNNSDSRDMTVFKDENGKAYLLHSSEWNAILYAGELSYDYCQTTNRFTRNIEKGYREAPAIFKRNGEYYLLTSGCTGWDPNPARIAMAENILGPWKVMGNPCTGPHADKTYFAQSTFIFSVAGRSDAYITMFDKWNKRDLEASRYLWLPVRSTGEDIQIEWQKEWDLSYFG